MATSPSATPANSLPAGSTILIGDQTNGVVYSLTVYNDGSVTGQMPATISDILQVTLTDPSGNKATFTISQFVAADGTTAIGAGGGTVTGAGGTAIIIPAGAPTDVVLDGTMALVGTGSNVLVVDLTNPYDPVSGGQITGSFGTRLALDPNGILIAAGNVPRAIFPNSTVQTTTLQGPITISSPSQGATFPVIAPNYNVAAPITFNATTPNSPSVSWKLNLAYTTSGGKCSGCTNSQSLTTASGANGTETYQSMGGQLVATATDGANSSASVTAYVVGSPIPNSQITTQLTNVYQPGFQGFTPNLLCHIAVQESGYAQFITKTLYGVSARWPVENGATSKVPAGSYIGLMQVPVTMTTAFDWVQNTIAGNGVFMGKIGLVT